MESDLRRGVVGGNFASTTSTVRPPAVNLPERMILNQIAQVIFDKKGYNILGIDVRGVSTLTDYVIIAEGNVDRHVIAIADSIISLLKQEGCQPIHVEGRELGDWVVIDFLDIMVHLFMPGLREKYRLEELWKNGSLIDFNLRLELA